MKTARPLLFFLAAAIGFMDCRRAPAGQLTVGTSVSLSLAGQSSEKEKPTIVSPFPGGEGEISTAEARGSNKTVHGEVANETWQSALAKMPLGTRVTELDRTNCIPLMLNAFQSNNVVKALIFMPGAVDELYFFHRVHAKLFSANPSLADAVAALTNQTYIQADFRPPFLLLHTTEDALEPMAIVKSQSTAAKLYARTIPGLLVFNDCEWDNLRSTLKKKLSISLHPFSNAPDSWHFYRHNFAACGLNQWELLEAIALAGKTTFTLHWWAADFQSDGRTAPVPALTNFPAQ